MSLIVNGNKIMQSRSIGYEIIDDAPLEVIYSVENWVRPSEWISVPTPATGSEVVNILYGVYDSGPNFLSIQASSTFSVDWGDGSSQSASPGSYLRKEFMFGSYSSGTLTSDGFRQALVTVTPKFIRGDHIAAVVANRHVDPLSSLTYTSFDTSGIVLLLSVKPPIKTMELPTVTEPWP